MGFFNPSFNHRKRESRKADAQKNQRGYTNVQASGDFFYGTQSCRPVLFTGTGNPRLAARIAEHLGLSVGSLKIDRYSGGFYTVEESGGFPSFKIKEFIKGRDVIVVDNMGLEFLSLVSSCKQKGARTISAFGFIPAAGPQSLNSLKLAETGISDFGANRHLLIDEVFLQRNLIIPYLKTKGHPVADVLVIALDSFGRGIADGFRAQLSNNDVLMISAENYIAEIKASAAAIKGKLVMLIDGKIYTTENMARIAKVLKEHGAVEVYACIMHACRYGPEVVRSLVNDIFQEIVISDMVDMEDIASFPKFTILPASERIASVIAYNSYHNNNIGEE